MKKEVSKEQLDDFLEMLGLNAKDLASSLGLDNDEDDTQPELLGMAYLEDDDKDYVAYSGFAPFGVEGTHPTWVHDYLEKPSESSNAYELSMVFHDEDKLAQFLKDRDIDPVTLGATDIKPMTKKDWLVAKLLNGEFDIPSKNTSNKVEDLREKLSSAMPTKNKIGDLAQKVADALKQD